jgi:hypothetical protein
MNGLIIFTSHSQSHAARDDDWEKDYGDADEMDGQAGTNLANISARRRHSEDMPRAGICPDKKRCWITKVRIDPHGASSSRSITKGGNRFASLVG